MPNLCLKTQFKNEVPEIITMSISDEDTSSILLETGANTIEDIYVLFLLGEYYKIYEHPVWGQRNYVTSTSRTTLNNSFPTFSIILGQVSDAGNTPNHETTTTSLLTFNTETLVNSIKESIPPYYELSQNDWESLVDSTPTISLGQLVEQYSNMPSGGFEVRFETSRLKIMPMDEQDFGLLDGELGPYSDSYETVKSKLGAVSNGLDEKSTPVQLKSEGGVEFIEVVTEAYTKSSNMLFFPPGGGPMSAN